MILNDLSTIRRHLTNLAIEQTYQIPNWELLQPQEAEKYAQERIAYYARLRAMEMATFLAVGRSAPKAWMEQIQASVLPNGKAQERFLSVAHFLARYGEGFGDDFLAQLELDPRRLHLITASRAPSGTGGGNS